MAGKLMLALGWELTVDVDQRIKVEGFQFLSMDDWIGFSHTRGGWIQETGSGSCQSLKGLGLETWHSITSIEFSWLSRHST